jgi:hypothetical protein
MTFSSHLNFHNPFWEYLRPLNDYMARLQYVSQTGHFVAPVDHYTHYDNFPSWTPTDDDYPLEFSLMANGYNFDFINEDILLNHATVRDRELHTPGGGYKALVFRNERRLTRALVEKLHQFSQEGLPIIFAEAPPTEEIAFLDYVENGKTIRQLITEMLGGVVPENTTASAEQKNGSVAFVKDATRVPAMLEGALGVSPNLRFQSPQPNIFFAQFDHGPVQFYFLRNPKPQPQDARIEFSRKGIPEIWDPWTGQASPAAHYASNEHGTSLTIHLDGYGSKLVAVRDAPQELHVTRSNFEKLGFVDCRLAGISRVPGTYRATLSDGRTLETAIGEQEITETVTLGPNWHLEAVGKDKNGKDYAVEYHLADLKDWTLVPELRNFSGKGHYSLDFQLAGQYFKPQLGIDLDLGNLHDVAQVWINQKKAATLLLRL